jgi:MFS family permease
MEKYEAEESPVAGVTQLPLPSINALRALQDRNFRWYLSGLMVSMAGSYMQQVAEGWLLYQITNSVFTLGYIGFITMIPMVPWAFVAGALADRMSRKKLLMVVQVGQIFPPLILAWLVWNDAVQVWHVIVLNLVMAAMTTIDQPVRQAMIAEMLQDEDLENGLVLTSAGINVARVVGPALAGVFIGIAGLGGVFVLNAATFLAVVFALFMVKVAPYQKSVNQRSLGGALVDGVRYLMSERVLLAITILLITLSLFVLPYQMLLPVFARDVFNQGAAGLGMLTAVAGVGAILGALAVAYIPSSQYSRFIGLLVISSPLCLLIFALTRNFPLACLALTLCSAGIVALKTIGFTVIQVRTPNELRGRITSMLLLMMGATPRFGGLVIGYAAALVGTPFAMSLGAAASLVGGLLVIAVFRPQLRRLQ